MNDVFTIIASSCGMVMFLGAFLGFFAFLRYLRYREIITLAEKGLVDPRYAGNGKGTLWWGLVITLVGVALCLGLYPLGWMFPQNLFPLNFGPWMLVGLVPTFFGISLLAIYSLKQREEKEKGKQPAVPHHAALEEPLDKGDETA